MSEKPRHTLSSGNVFADLGLSDADELLAKADLAIEIARTIERKALTQAEAAAILGIDQPKISALVRGRLKGFSMERLYRFLNALGRDVEIVLRPAVQERKHGTLRVITSNRTDAPAARRASKQTIPTTKSAGNTRSKVRKAR